MNVVCHIKSQLLRDYLHFLFAYEEEAFSVFRDSKEGKFICSMIRYSDFPVETKINPNTVVFFRLPRTSAMPGLFTRFCYITHDDQVKIEDYLKATFDVDFIQYYYSGKNMGLQQKVVIQTFILSRKLANMIGNTEQLKKRQYRSEEKKIKQMSERLAKRVRVQNAIITKTIKEYQAVII
ncbi:hypothetical protein ACR79T_10135 [Sphingobacterium spiritivorum]|uniref:hypothetical protein n=1 Tax=Sphingobacterium spiritivorum TaxID=258 RepID=UPI003DA205FE